MTPPLRVWRNVLIFLLLVTTFVLVRFSGEHSPYNQTATYYQEKIKQFHQTGTDTISMVVLGSSLAINAFGAVPDLNVTCKPVKILHLGLMGLNMDAIQAFGLLKTLADFPPDYLFFESNLLVSYSDATDPEKFVTNFNVWFVRMKPLTLIWNNGLFMHKAIEMLMQQLPAVHFSKQKDLTQTKLRSYRQYAITENAQKVIDAPFRKLIDNHCKIILVKFPVIETPALQKVQPVFDKKVSEFQTKYGTRLWELPSNQIHDALFVDGAHMNESGSRVFVPWFLDHLNQEICTN